MNLHEFSANIYILFTLVMATMFPNLTYKGLPLWKAVIILKVIWKSVDAGCDPESDHIVYWGWKSYEVSPRI